MPKIVGSEGCLGLRRDRELGVRSHARQAAAMGSEMARSHDMDGRLEGTILHIKSGMVRKLWGLRC